jgi:hypothetical protein
MGNLVPDLCVCNEREGKSNYKKIIELGMGQQKVVLTDYTEILSQALLLDEQKTILSTYLISEVICVVEPEIDLTQSVVMINSVNMKNGSELHMKIVCIKKWMFLLYLISPEEKQKQMVTEFRFKCQMENKKKIANLKTVVEGLEKFSIENEKLNWTAEGMGYKTFAYLKRLLGNYSN